MDGEGQVSPNEAPGTQDGPQPDVIEVARGKTVDVITCMINGDTLDVRKMSVETTKVVDGYIVPKHYRREGTREASLLYSGD